MTPLVTQQFEVDDALRAIETAHRPGPGDVKSHIRFTAGV
jgi:hypothetical protein